MTLEELTQEELVWLLRENVTGFDERKLLSFVLWRRQRNAADKQFEIIEEQRKIGEKMRELIAPYKTGNQYRVPWNVWQEYKKMGKESSAAHDEFLRLVDIVLDSSKEREAIFKDWENNHENQD